MDDEFTDDMMRMLLVIDAYTREGHEDNPIWVKELPLMAIIYQGIVKRLFRDYDYSPWSVPMLDGTREWLNISREGKDDLEDLLNLRMLSILRVSTSQYGFVTAYRLTESGQEKINDATESIRQETMALIHHTCGDLYSITMNGSEISFRCDSCNFDEEILIGEIEDIPYTTKAYLPSFNFGWFGNEKDGYFDQTEEGT
ncbi:MAG: hypothetical protein ACTSYJ_10190 [Candidatus Thorarchaeota archaeon]